MDFAREIELVKSRMRQLNEQIRSVSQASVMAGYSAEEVIVMEQEAWATKILQLESFRQQLSQQVKTSFMEALDEHATKTRQRLQELQHNLYHISLMLNAD